MTFSWSNISKYIYFVYNVSSRSKLITQYTLNRKYSTWNAKDIWITWIFALCSFTYLHLQLYTCLIWNIMPRWRILCHKNWLWNIDFQCACIHLSSCMTTLRNACNNKWNWKWSKNINITFYLQTFGIKICHYLQIYVI